jgi:hypothetical protein
MEDILKDRKRKRYADENYDDDIIGHGIRQITKKVRREVSGAVHEFKNDVKNEWRAAAKETLSKPIVRAAEKVWENRHQETRHLAKKAREAAWREGKKEVKKQAVKALRNAGRRFLAANWRTLERYGIKISEDDYEDMSSIVSRILTKGWRGWGDVVRQYANNQAMRALEDSGIDIEEQHLKEVLEHPDAEHVAARAMRSLADRYGINIRKNKIVDEFMDDPSLKRQFRRIIKRAIRNGRGKIKQALTEAEEGIEAAAESSEVAEAEALAETAMELAPLLL